MSFNLNLRNFTQLKIYDFCQPESDFSVPKFLFVIFTSSPKWTNNIIVKYTTPQLGLTHFKTIILFRVCEMKS
jgi:hypothetical protein